MYSDGQAEIRLGKVVKQRRSEMWIATKALDTTRDGARRQLETSLSRLQTDYVDEWRLHNLKDYDRLDAFTASLRIDRPSATELFRRQCFISGDPDETAAPHIIDHVGADCFMWATDYPHPDHPHTWVDDLVRYAETLPAEARAKVLGDNVRRIYKLDC